jgi:hypothetical protein
MARPRKYTRVEDMQQAIDKYFNDCDLKEEPYTISGLALALDFDSRTSLLNYCDYEDEDDESFLDTIKRAKAKCEFDIERGLLSGKYNATGAIFNLKNNYNWKDKQEIEADVSSSVDITIELSDE